MKSVFCCYCVGFLSLFLPGVATARKNSATFVPRRAHTKLVTAMRGGDLGDVSGEDLAKTFSVLASGDALAGTLFPQASMKWFGVNIAEGSLAEAMMNSVGASAATVALSTYLAVTGKTSIEEAVGYGLGARLLSLTRLLLTERYVQLGMTKAMVGSMWVLLAVTVYALFQGMDEAKPLAQVASLMIAFHGLGLVTKAEAVVAKASKGKATDKTTVAMTSLNGSYMVSAGLTTALLISGKDPVKTVGYSTIIFVPAFLKWAEIVPVDSVFGIEIGIWFMAVAALLAAIAAGTLL